jgi:hypothetical protein
LARWPISNFAGWPILISPHFGEIRVGIPIQQADRNTPLTTSGYLPLDLSTVAPPTTLVL